MTVYHGKLLELLSIDNECEKLFLRIRLSFDQQLELLWEIDHDTAESLKSVTTFEGTYKYRLSFHSSWNSTKKQYMSFLTRTYRNQSNRIYFSCSKEYVNGLNSIKLLSQIGETHTLSFLSTYPTDEPESEPEPELEQEKKDRKPIFSKFRFVGVASIMILAAIALETESVKKEITVKPEEQKTLSAYVKKAAASPVQSSIPHTEVINDITYRIPEDSVALTFDDGPSKYTTKIVDILKKYQVGGTFFFIGDNVKKHPDYVHYVISNGYSVGSHSMNHPNLTSLSYKEQEKEIVQADQLIEEITSVPVNLFRPPYGSMNRLTINAASKHNNKMILWDIDSEDWKNRNSNEIFNHIRNSKASGSIILLHESQVVVDTLPRIIEYIQRKNLQIVDLK